MFNRNALPDPEALSLAQAARYLNVCSKILRKYVYEGFVAPDARGQFKRTDLDQVGAKIRERGQ